MTESLQNNPTILLVDDEELMREVTTLMIEEHGGRVIAAIDGLDAVERFAENRGKIDYVLMDFSMPRMNGYEAFLEMRKLDPDIPVLIISGLKIVPELEKLNQEGQVDFLSKPFHEAELLKGLKRLETKKKANPN